MGILYLMRSGLLAVPGIHVVSIVLVAFLFVVLYVGVADAHRPLFTDSNANDPTTAVRISDPAVSHVVYIEITESTPHKWMVFDNDERRRVPLMLGVPRGISLKPVEPVVVLFGPGGQAEEGEAFVISRGEDSHRFYEPVTGTESQILIDTEVELAEPGTYYGVVYDAAGQGGKLWVSIGESEGFSWRDVLRLPGWIGEVRRFHEVGGWPRWARIATLVLLASVFTISAWLRLGRRSKP